MHQPLKKGGAHTKEEVRPKVQAAAAAACLQCSFVNRVVSLRVKLLSTEILQQGDIGAPAA